MVSLIVSEELEQSNKQIMPPAPIIQEKSDIFVPPIDSVGLDILNEQHVNHPNLIIITPMEPVAPPQEQSPIESEMEQPPAHIY